MPVDPDPNPVNPSPGDAVADATAFTFPSAEPAIPAPILIHPVFTVPVDPDNPIPVHIVFVNPVPSNLTPA